MFDNIDIGVSQQILFQWAQKLCQLKNRKTIASREIQTSIRLLCPNLAERYVSWGTKFVTDFNSDHNDVDNNVDNMAQHNKLCNDIYKFTKECRQYVENYRLSPMVYLYGVYHNLEQYIKVAHDVEFINTYVKNRHNIFVNEESIIESFIRCSTIIQGYHRKKYIHVSDLELSKELLLHNFDKKIKPISVDDFENEVNKIVLDYMDYNVFTKHTKKELYSIISNIKSDHF